MKNKILIVLFSLASFCSFANENYCDIVNGGVTAGYMCVEQKISSAQKQLDIAFNSAIERAKEEQKSMNDNIVESLNKAQSSWIEFRDNQCLFDGQTMTSSPWQGVQVEECKLKKILSRIDYLNSLFRG
ncbi:lysozyme inhibitor LprI family protein [Aliivibrio sifiae]|uniref:lysozyme inhibitor LprI family protein n=1 Tax=Aliivibrio sifiae TaxID=566293 RepID=UPI000769BB34